MSDRWRWDPGHAAWFASTPAFTAAVIYERRLTPGGGWRAVPGAADARSYVVAIVGPSWPGRSIIGYTERYRLAGSLVQVKAKLEAAILRRQRAWEAWRDRPDVLDSPASEASGAGSTSAPLVSDRPAPAGPAEQEVPA